MTREHGRRRLRVHRGQHEKIRAWMLLGTVATFIIGSLWYTVLTGDYAAGRPRSDIVAAAGR